MHIMNSLALSGEGALERKPRKVHVIAINRVISCTELSWKSYVQR